MDEAANKYPEGEGWTLYYSPEGYPYYYNAVTGVSEWATDYSAQEIYNNSVDNSGGQPAVTTDINLEDEEADESEDEDSGEDDDGDEDDDDEDESEDEEDEEDKSLEAQFKSYLRTPEGLAAMEAELERVGKSLDKRTSNAASAKEREYVRNIMLSKDKVPAGSSSSSSNDFSLSYSSFITWGNKLTQYASSWIVPAATAPSASKLTKGKLKRAATAKTERVVKKQDEGGTTKQRVTTGAGAGPVASSSSELDDVEVGGKQAPESPSNNSRATNEDEDTSDNDSISTDDSDVKEVTAPLFNEFSSWLSWENGQRIWSRTTEAGSHVVSSTNELLEQYEVKQKTSKALEAVGERVIPIVSNLSTTVMDTTYAAWQGCFNRLNPLMITFVEQVVDGNAIIRSPPAAIESASSSSAAAANKGEEERDVEMHSSQQEDDTNSTMKASSLSTGPNTCSSPSLVSAAAAASNSKSLPVPYTSSPSSTATVKPPASMQITPSPRGFPSGPPPKGPSPRAPIPSTSTSRARAPPPASAAVIAAAMASVEPPPAIAPVTCSPLVPAAPVSQTDRKSTEHSDGWKTLEFSPLKPNYATSSSSSSTDAAAALDETETIRTEEISAATFSSTNSTGTITLQSSAVQEAAGDGAKRQQNDEAAAVIGTADIEISISPANDDNDDNDDNDSNNNHENTCNDAVADAGALYAKTCANENSNFTFDDAERNANTKEEEEEEGKDSASAASSASLLETALKGDNNVESVDSSAPGVASSSAAAADDDIVSPAPTAAVVTADDSFVISIDDGTPIKMKEVDSRVEDSPAAGGDADAVAATDANGVVPAAAAAAADIAATPEPSATTTPMSNKTDSNNNYSGGANSSHKKNRKKKHKK